MQYLFPVPEIGLNEKNPNRLYYAFDGDNMAYAVADPSSGDVLCIEFIPGSMPALGIRVVESVQDWFDGMNESFFGLDDDSVRAELRATAEKYGVTLSDEKAALLAE